MKTKFLTLSFILLAVSIFGQSNFNNHSKKPIMPFFSNPDFDKSSMPYPSLRWDTLIADTAYQGIKATGNVAMFYGKNHYTLVSPVIIVDGFDPGDKRPIEGLYQIANQQNLVDTIRAYGSDVVLLNFYAGTDYIQRNAMLVVKLLDTINQIMSHDSTLLTEPQIVLIGPSMGGLITRYALRYMEMHNIDHHVRNWISFDSPQKGANIALGLQHWLRFFAEVAGSTDAQTSLSRLNSPASKQMLLYHYTATNDSTAGPTNIFTDFYNELNAMGFPLKSRIVAFADGSGYGVNQPYAPGDSIIKYEYSDNEVDLRGNVWAVPDQTAHVIFDGWYNSILPFDEVFETINVKNTLPYDGTPGSYINSFQELADSDPGYGDIIAYHDNHSFIPTISSLCIENTISPNFNVSANLSNIVTPFDTIYFPHNNLEHVEISPEVFQWFKKEIINFPPIIISNPLNHVFENQFYEYKILFTDENYWNHFSLNIENLPAFLNMDTTNWKIFGTPGNSDVGNYNIIIKVSDGLSTTIQNFNLEVINVNNPPIVSHPTEDFVIQTDTMFYYTFPSNNIIDIDENDSLVYNVTKIGNSGLPAWLNYNTNINTIFGYPLSQDTGTYHLIRKATDMAGAFAIDSFAIKVISNINNGIKIIDNNNFIVFPNPGSDNVNVIFPDAQKRTISIYNENNQNLICVDTHESRISINCSTLHSGIYYLKITTKDLVNTSKLVIQKR